MYLPPFSSEEPKTVALPCGKYHLLLLALTCHVPASPEAPHYDQCKGDQRIHILHVTVLLLHVTTVLLSYTLNSHLFPKLRKHSLHLSRPSQGNHSVVPLIIPVALFWTLSSAITAFLTCWEPDLHRFREVHCNLSLFAALFSIPLLLIPNTVCFFDHCWAPSWHFNGTIYYIPKISFLNGNALLRAHHLSGELVLFFPPCVSLHIYLYWFPTAISEPENCSALAFNRLIAYY